MDMNEVSKFEQAKVGTLKLSEAIRIGARLRPQAFGGWFVDGGSCAIGAALEAVGLRDDDMDVRGGVLMEHFPQLANPGYTPLAREIIRLNDGKKMSRESIADWLEWQGL